MTITICLLMLAILAFVTCLVAVLSAKAAEKMDEFL